MLILGETSGSNFTYYFLWKICVSNEPSWHKNIREYEPPSFTLPPNKKSDANQNIWYPVTTYVPSSLKQESGLEAVMLVHHKHLIWFSLVFSVLKWSRLQLVRKCIQAVETRGQCCLMGTPLLLWSLLT